MLLEEILDLSLLEEMVENGYIRRKVHPGDSSWVIYNYAEKAVYERVWNEATLQCRGLIVFEDEDEHGDGPVVLARPLKKFFNLSEIGVENLPTSPCHVTEKMDGSLGILYRGFDDEWAIATRGSFTSEQAIMATEILRNKYDGVFFCEDCTYVFEIIYSSNRIVVDYGDMEDLVLLDIIDNATGNSNLDDFSHYCDWPGPVVERHPYSTVVEVLAAPQTKNAEGFVLHWEDGTRAKAKFDEYVRLHAIVTNTSSVTVWKALVAGDPLSGLLEHVPDEFSDWVRSLALELEFGHDQICGYVLDELEEARLRLDESHGEGNWSRGQFAALIAKNPYRAELFLAMDGKDLSSLVWKKIKPDRTLPFKQEV